jgi:hypothetical protein
MTTESQAPEQEVTTEEYQKPVENAMRAARVTGAYLIIARYNLDKELAVNAAGEHKTARDTARELFPQQNTKGLQNLPGVRTCHTFRSPFFDRLPDDFFFKEDGEQQALTQSAIADLKQEAAQAALARSGNEDLNAENPRKEDTLGIGWIAIIDAHAYPSFVKRMGGENSPFSRVFDITVIELNDDRTTKDIYQLMTPRSWN